MKKTLIIILILLPVISFSQEQLKVKGVTLKTVEITFLPDQTEPEKVNNTFDEIPIMITGDVLRIGNELYKVVYIVKKRFSAYYRIYYREEMQDKLSDYPEIIEFVEYSVADKTLTKVDRRGSKIIYMSYELE